jgi:hypothetical protein
MEYDVLARGFAAAAAATTASTHHSTLPPTRPTSTRA